MTKLLRLLLFLTALALLVVHAGFVLALPWATALWPWPDTPLSYIFVGSILAAVALPIAWVALSGELAALRGGALDFTVTYAGLSAFFVWYFTEQGLSPVNPFTLFAVAGLIANIIIAAAAWQTPFRDRRPMPTLVRWSFLLFALVLIAVGIALVMQLPHLFPWPLKPPTSVVIGCVFLGAAAYFLYGFAVPLWSNAAGQLVGFLAYDLVLLAPFVAHFDKVADAHRLSLIVYVTVLAYSAVLAVYFLLVHRPTRLSRAF